MDKQFRSRFVEVIKKLYINVPLQLLDVMQVPTYAKYLWPTTKVIKLTEECRVAVLNKLLTKKKDYTNTLTMRFVTLVRGVSVMTYVVFDKLNYTTLSPTPIFCL